MFHKSKPKSFDHCLPQRHIQCAFKKLILLKPRHLNILVHYIPKSLLLQLKLKQRGVLIAFHRSTPFSLQTEIKDPEGRYLILTGHLCDALITVVSYYAPKRSQSSFLSHLFQVIDSHKMGTLLICGDSNQVLHPYTDKFPTPITSNSQSRMFQRLLQRHSLLDSWREINPTKRQYSFYSHPHKSFSRIDHILISISMFPELLTSSVIPFTWTDHCAIISTFAFLIPKTQDPTWHINDSTLSHPSHSTDLEIAIKDYLKNNKTPDISPLTLWEAHKPVLHRICLCQASYLKREKKKLQQK